MAKKKKAPAVDFAERFIPIGPPDGGALFSLLHCGVCASQGVTYEEALHHVQTTNPAGTRNNWQMSDDAKPFPCPDVEGRTHFLFTC